MLVHNKKLNQCSCGSEKMPDLDSDDMIPTWSVRCYNCGKFCHDENWSFEGAVRVWNKENNKSKNYFIFDNYNNQKLIKHDERN